MDKTYIITVNRNGREKQLNPMTLKELEKYFAYTLEKGRSYQKERGNKKIPLKFNNINKFVDAINNAESNAASNGYSNTYYSLSEEQNIGGLPMGITNVVNDILEGKSITQSILSYHSRLAESDAVDDPAVYYKVVYGYDMSIVKLDAPTTDYGAILDILIDNMEAEGIGAPYLVSISDAENDYNEDEYVIGGNHGLALIHNGNFTIEEITPNKAAQYNKENHIDIYCESYQLTEGAGRLVSVKVVQEPYGKGVEVVDSNGAVYKYVVDETDPKYYTPEKVKNAVWGLAKSHNYDMGVIYNFLKNHTLDYYDKDVTKRAQLDKTEIVKEPNGEGLKVTLDNGRVYRYTVDINDPKYNTLDDLKNGADGMYRHSASIDGVLRFLDNHALLYARESLEALKHRMVNEKRYRSSK